MVRESTAFIAKTKQKQNTKKPHTRKKYGQLMFKRSELPNGFQRRVFKGKVREGPQAV